MENNFRPVLTIRIFGEDKCFGPGVAVLLRRVRELHSLRAAAMSIGMAYSKAWTILKNAQLSLGFKLLDYLFFFTCYFIFKYWFITCKSIYY